MKFENSTNTNEEFFINKTNEVLKGMDKICPTCKKHFMKTSSEWAYKLNGKAYCSWTCMRKKERKK